MSFSFSLEKYFGCIMYSRKTTYSNLIFFLHCCSSLVSLKMPHSSFQCSRFQSVPCIDDCKANTWMKWNWLLSQRIFLISTYFFWNFFVVYFYRRNKMLQFATCVFKTRIYDNNFVGLSKSNLNVQKHATVHSQLVSQSQIYYFFALQIQLSSAK